jgi:hypothetical protein
MNVILRLSLPLLVVSALVSAGGECRAQSAGLQKAKGTVGGGLLGAEVVLMTEAALGVQPAWAYIVGGVAGAGAGAVGGYYLSDGGSNKPSSFLLAGGIALSIPTMIAVLTATHYEPPDSYRLDVAPEDEPLLEEEILSPDAPPPPAARLDIPTITVAQAFSREEMYIFGVRQVTELHLSLLHGAF